MMFDFFETRTVERDQTLDAKRIARVMACLLEIQNDCMDELTGLSQRIENYKTRKRAAKKSSFIYFEPQAALDSFSSKSLSAADLRIEMLGGYINTCMKLRTQFMIDIQINQTAVDELVEFSNDYKNKNAA